MKQNEEKKQNTQTFTFFFACNHFFCGINTPELEITALDSTWIGFPSTF